MPRSEEKKKALGRIIAVISAVICICALGLSVYFGTQRKTATNICTAVMREDYKSLGKLLDDYDSELEEEVKSRRAKLMEAGGFEDDALMHVRINFKGRKMLSLTEWEYRFTATFYDDDGHSLTTEENVLKIR